MRAGQSDGRTSRSRPSISSSVRRTAVFPILRLLCARTYPLSFGEVSGQVRHGRIRRYRHGVGLGRWRGPEGSSPQKALTKIRWLSSRATTARGIRAAQVSSRAAKDPRTKGVCANPSSLGFPGEIPAGSMGEGIASAMDMLPTFAKLAGASVPPSSVDGVDIWGMLTGEKPFLSRDPFLFFDRFDLQCVRWGPWKLHLSRYNSYAWTADPPEGRVNLPLRRRNCTTWTMTRAENYDRAPENGQYRRVPEKASGRVDVVDAGRRSSRMARYMLRQVEETPVGALPA